jgi:hypothetical protein
MSHAPLLAWAARRPGAAQLPGGAGVAVALCGHGLHVTLLPSEACGARARSPHAAAATDTDASPCVRISLRHARSGAPLLRLALSGVLLRTEEEAPGHAAEAWVERAQLSLLDGEIRGPDSAVGALTQDGAACSLGAALDAIWAAAELHPVHLDALVAAAAAGVPHAASALPECLAPACAPACAAPAPAAAPAHDAGTRCRVSDEYDRDYVIATALFKHAGAALGVRERLACVRVCTAWRDVATHPMYHARLALPPDGSDAALLEAAAAVAGAHGARRRSEEGEAPLLLQVDVSACERVTYAGMLHALRAAPSCMRTLRVRAMASSTVARARDGVILWPVQALQLDAAGGAALAVLACAECTDVQVASEMLLAMQPACLAVERIVLDVQRARERETECRSALYCLRTLARAAACAPPGRIRTATALTLRVSEGVVDLLRVDAHAQHVLTELRAVLPGGAVIVAR